MTKTRSLRASTSFSLWLIKIIRRPSALSWLRTRNSSSISYVVSTEIGSSRIKIRDSITNALKISIRCCYRPATVIPWLVGQHKNDRRRAAAKLTNKIFILLRPIGQLFLFWPSLLLSTCHRLRKMFSAAVNVEINIGPGVPCQYLALLPRWVS